MCEGVVEALREQKSGGNYMERGARIRLVCVAVLLISVTACSVTDFKKPIGDFAQATRDSESALKGLDQEVTNAYADLIRRRVLAKELLVQITAGDCQTSSERCRIVVKDRDGNEQALSPEPALKNMITLMGAVRAYADGLSAIVNADTAAKVETQVNATIGNLTNLAGTVKKLGGQDKTTSINLAEYATPVGQIVNWTVGQYVAKVQFDGLKRATADAEDVVSAAANIFELTAGEAALTPRARLAEVVSVRVDALRDKLTAANLDKLIASASHYDQQLLAKPPAVFARLDDAHAALVQKLHNDDVSLADVVAKIEVFAEEAKILAKAIKDLQKVGEKKGES